MKKLRIVVCLNNMLFVIGRLVLLYVLIYKNRNGSGFFLSVVMMVFKVVFFCFFVGEGGEE